MPTALLGGEHYRYTIAWFNELRTNPMAVDGMAGRRLKKREDREEPESMRQILPECGEWAS